MDTTENPRFLLQNSITKVEKTVLFLSASVADFVEYDPLRLYTPKEQEPYDALFDRFVRAVEVSIYVFKTYKYYLEGTKEGSLRDILGYMQRLNLVTDPLMWFEMRDVRNKIVHDYLPEQTAELLHLIAKKYTQELVLTCQKLQKIP